jgi:hypothetical protein
LNIFSGLHIFRYLDLIRFFSTNISGFLRKNFKNNPLMRFNGSEAGYSYLLSAWLLI